eukprot:366531-Chlamydomonas_euryale.AAC.5
MPYFKATSTAASQLAPDDMHLSADRTKLCYVCGTTLWYGLRPLAAGVGVCKQVKASGARAAWHGRRR